MKTGDIAYSRDGVPMTVESCNGIHTVCMWFGIDAKANWTGPHRRRFRRRDLRAGGKKSERAFAALGRASASAMLGRRR